MMKAGPVGRRSWRHSLSLFPDFLFPARGCAPKTTSLGLSACSLFHLSRPSCSADGPAKPLFNADAMGPWSCLLQLLLEARRKPSMPPHGTLLDCFYCCSFACPVMRRTRDCACEAASKKGGWRGESHNTLFGLPSAPTVPACPHSCDRDRLHPVGTVCKGQGGSLRAPWTTILRICHLSTECSPSPPHLMLFG